MMQDLLRGWCVVSGLYLAQCRLILWHCLMVATLFGLNLTQVYLFFFFFATWL